MFIFLHRIRPSETSVNKKLKYIDFGTEMMPLNIGVSFNMAGMKLNSNMSQLS